MYFNPYIGRSDILCMAVTQTFFWSQIVVRLWIIAGAQDVYLQSLNTDVTSGQKVCPGLLLMLECVVTETSFLEWQRNNIEILPNFNIGDPPGERNSTSDPYTLVLVSIDVDQARRVANMTARLKANISLLNSTDEITCETLERSSSIMLNYTLRGPPPAPVIGTDFSISRSPEEDDNSTFKFMISWNSSSAFTGTNAVTSYIVTPPTITTEGRDVAVDCPPSCSLDAPCQCSTGLRLEERIIINISAINCGTQQGEAVEVTVASSCPLIDLGTVENTTVTDSSCTRRVTIPKGMGCFENTAVDSVVSYKCNEGYRARGSNLKRTCLINGSWSGSIPKCREFKVPQQSSNSRIIIISVVVVVVGVLILTIVIVTVTVTALIIKRKCRKSASQKPAIYRFQPEPQENYRE